MPAVDSHTPRASGRRPRRERATSAVAFALMAPIIFMVLFGIAEGGRLIFDWLIITNEAREAARYGAVRYDPTRSASQQIAEISSYLDGRLVGVLPREAATPGVPNPQVNVVIGGSPTAVAVTITHRVQLIIPVVSALLPNPFPVSAHSQMRAE